MLAVFEKAIGNPPEELGLPSVGFDLEGKRTREEISETFQLLWQDSTLFQFSNGNFMALSQEAKSSLHPRSMVVMDDIFCIFVGTFGNISEVRRYYGLSRRETEAMVVVEAYKVLRDRAPYPPDQVIRDLEGKCAFILFDAKSGALFVARDREGSVELQWGMAGDGSLVLSDDPNTIEATCGKSCAPFPPGATRPKGGNFLCRQFEQRVREGVGDWRIKSDPAAKLLSAKIHPFLRSAFALPNFTRISTSFLPKPHSKAPVTFEMEVSALNGLQYDEEKALNSLLDAFGSVFSLKDIASAYCEAGRNADLAGEILYAMQGSTSSVATDASNGEVKNDESLESSHGNHSQNFCQENGGFTSPKQKQQPVLAASDASHGKVKKDEPSESSCSDSSLNSWQANGDLRALKQKWRPASGGTVSSMLGKGYMKSAPLANGSCPGTKPLKVDSKELPKSVLWGEGEGLKSSSLKEDRLHKDMEDFLCKMLGEGFQLDRDVIRDVLDSCGYDMQKSMEKLLDHSAVSLEKEHKSLGEASKKTNDMHPRAGRPSQEMNRVLNASGGARQLKDRNDIQKEVLAALFNGPERFDELPRRRMRSAKRSIALGELVEGPLIESAVEKEVDRVCSQENKKDDEVEEDSFQALRRAVEEYRGMMKEYYKSAVDSFAKGDRDQANGFLQEGQFFREKARKADEESNQKIFETRNMETEDEMLLDLHGHGAKEALSLLKCHLSSLAGIPSFKYLKVIVEKNEEDSLKGSRRRLVMKLLEKESISWSEGETPGIILIRLDNINPKRLSFAKQ